MNDTPPLTLIQVNARYVGESRAWRLLSKWHMFLHAVGYAFCSKSNKSLASVRAFIANSTQG